MALEVTTYVLDACGVIAYLQKEEGGDRLRDLFKQDDRNRFLIHSVNLGEIYYDFLRRNTEAESQELFDDIAKLPVDIIWTLDITLLKLVGKYKTSFKMSYADCFVAALAEREDGIVITTDHSEFDAIRMRRR